MRLILHIGMGKTGTSTLQSTLNEHAAELAKFGILYPTPPSRSNNHNLLTCLHRPANRLSREFTAGGTRSIESLHATATEYWEGLERQIREAKVETVILSGEYLFGSLKRDLVQLNDFLATLFDDIRIVAYVREPASYFLSLVQQVVKASYDVRAPANHKMPIRRCLSDFKAVFGEQVYVRAFDRTALIGGCIVRDFLGTFAPHMPMDGIKVLQTNESMSAEAMCIAQNFRRYGWPDQNDQFATESTRLIEKLNTMRDRTPQTPAKLRPEVKAGIQLAHQKDLEWLKQEFNLVFPDSNANGSTPREGEAPLGWHSQELTEILDVERWRLDATLYCLLKELSTRP